MSEETTVTQPETVEPAAPETSDAESRDRSRMFEFSEYVHVGPGADRCEAGETGGCNDTAHFHAWCRLPNPFQQQAIREKANAAKARKRRSLRDPESDSRAIIDSTVEEYVAMEDTEAMIDLLASKDFLEDHLKAMQEVSAEEEYEHIDDDRERLRALEAKPADERDEEEYDELGEHVASWGDAVEKARVELQAPLRNSLGEKSIDALADLLRNQFIEETSQQAWSETYDRWCWYTCTYRVRVPDKDQQATFPSERYFASIDALVACAPEVYEALKSTFLALEAASGRRVKGY